MKNLLVLILTFFVVSISNSQTGWYRVAPQPTEDNMMKVVATPDNTLFIITRNNSLLRSTDNGKSWETIFISAPLQTNLFNIQFVNNNTGWIVGSGGLILKTTDKGDTWIRQESYTYFELWNLFFLNETTGYVTGSSGTVLKTTDGGSNWYFKGIEQQNLSFGSISFKNENEGYSVASISSPGGGPPSYQLYKTTNSGDEWIVDSLRYRYLKSVKYLDQNTIVVTANEGSYFQQSSRLMLSTDSGLNWVNISPDTSKVAFYFLNDSGQFWCILGNDSMKILYKSNDFGNSWQAQSTLPEKISYFTITPTGLFINAESKSIYTSTHSGAIWNKISQDAIPFAYKIQFVNENTGYLRSVGSFYKTTSGGLEWTMLNNLPTLYSGGEINFLNESTGFVTRSELTSNLFKTTNGGESFVEIVVPYKIRLYKINFDNDKIRILSIRNLGNSEFKSGYLESTDLGNIWQLKEPDNWDNIGIYDINFFGNTAYAYTPKYFFKSINGGDNWILTDSSETNLNLEMQFLNFQFGWITKTDRTLNITYDGGATWSTNYLDDYNIIPNSAFSGFFYDESNGWIIAELNVGDTLFNSIGQVGILKTTDGGNTWRRTTLKSSPVGKLSIQMVNANIGFITNGVSLYKTTDGGAINISPITTNVVNEFHLHQNYPNPFNPVTIIKFDLPKQDFVTLNVYDMTGRLVTTLLNENLQQGTYQVKFDSRQHGSGSGLSSGVYFYSLSTRNFVLTNKMVIIK